MKLAKNIDWDINWDAEEELKEYFLPNEVEIPDDIDAEHVNDYLAENFVFYANSFKLVNLYG